MIKNKLTYLLTESFDNMSSISDRPTDSFIEIFNKNFI